MATRHESSFFKVNIVILFFTALAKDSTDNVHKLPEGFLKCMTRECSIDRIKSALSLIERMNSSADPCDNFYDFACGNFASPENQSNVLLKNFDSELYRLYVKDSKKVDNIIKETLNISMGYKPHQMIRNFYHSCLESETENYKENNDIRYLKRLIVELGNWPVLRGDRWNEKNFDWLTLVSESYRMNYFFETFIIFEAYSDENDTNIFSIKPPFSEFSNHESINQSDPQIKAYYDYMVNISVLLGADEPIAESELSDSLEFELELTSISNNLLIDPLFNNTALIEEMSVADMIERWPSVNWIKFFNMATQPFYEINNATIIRTAGSFIYLDNLIQILNFTPKRIQANFGLWKIIESLVPLVKNSTFRQVYQSYEQDEEYDNELNCIELVKELLPVSVHALYVKKLNDTRIKEAVTDIFIEIKQKLIDTLSSVDWIDEETKKNAIAKAEAIKGLIAYPDELLDDEMLEEYFADLDLDNDCFLKNVVQLERFNWIKKMENISKPFNIYYRANWNVTSFDLIKSRAHYIPTLNSFAMTTGLLQGLIFGIHRPNYMNYGATGTIIGHEVSHAFDPIRLKYDHIGRVNNLWTDKSYSAYQDKARCFIDQYNNYTLDASEQKLNGTRTLAENIADNVGIKIAYLAYQDWVVRNGPEPSLLELSSYTSNQLFWLSYASSWCTSYSPKGWEIQSNSVHLPANFRIIGSLSNMPEFSRDFNCPLDSNMNPRKKCKLF